MSLLRVPPQTLRWLPGALLLCLAGCSGLHSNESPAQVYTLAPPLPATAAAATPVPGVSPPGATLKVLRPLCFPGLDGDGIVLTRGGQQLDYFAHSRWAAPLPELLASAAIDALRAAGQFRAVQSDAAPLDADYLLQLEIRRFQADYHGEDAPTIHVQLVATLGRRSDRSLISSAVAEGAAPASANRMQNISAAFETALGQALAQLVNQVQPPTPAAQGLIRP